MRGRAIILATLALAVPIPAVALSGDEPADDSASAPLSHAGQLGVAATLGGCGLLDEQIVCEIDATFNPLADATGYTASVTLPDGSVMDFGEISPSGTASFWVNYAGDGTYTVQISAYGQADDDPQQEVIARDRVTTEVRDSTGGKKGGGAASEPPGESAPAEEPAAVTGEATTTPETTTPETTTTRETTTAPETTTTPAPTTAPEVPDTRAPAEPPAS